MTTSIYIKITALCALLTLTGCALTPEQQATRELQQRKAEQALQVNLARQCDIETANLMAHYFDPPIAETAEQKAEFTARYTQKVNDPVFQACYKMATEHYKMQQEIRQMRFYYDEWRWHRPWFYCYSC